MGRLSLVELGIIQNCVNTNITIDKCMLLLKAQGYQRKYKTIQDKYLSMLVKKQRKEKVAKRNNENIVEYRLKQLVRNAKARATDKQLDFDIDYEYIKSLYIEQDGYCKVTNKSMVFTLCGEGKNICNLLAPSIDRIDSTKGYTKDNVQLVCLAYNRAKSNASDKELKFIMGIKEYENLKESSYLLDNN